MTIYISALGEPVSAKEAYRLVMRPVPAEEPEEPDSPDLLAFKSRLKNELESLAVQYPFHQFAFSLVHQRLGLESKR